jgi:hypothetical protein
MFWPADGLLFLQPPPFIQPHLFHFPQFFAQGLSIGSLVQLFAQAKRPLAPLAVFPLPLSPCFALFCLVCAKPPKVVRNRLEISNNAKTKGLASIG